MRRTHTRRRTKRDKVEVIRHTASGKSVRLPSIYLKKPKGDSRD